MTIFENEDGLHCQAMQSFAVAYALRYGTRLPERSLPQPKGRMMPTPFELLRVADLIKLAADTARECSKINTNDDTARILEVSLRIEAAAEELAEIGRHMDTQRRDN